MSKTFEFLRYGIFSCEVMPEHRGKKFSLKFQFLMSAQQGEIYQI